LFLPGEAYGSGAWLEPGKTLDYYLLRNGDTIEYRRKMRILKVRTLDGAHKTMQVDDSQNVTNLMVVICTKMGEYFCSDKCMYFYRYLCAYVLIEESYIRYAGITNHDEYSLVRELPEENDIMNRSENYGTLTLRRKKEEREKDVKMDQLRKKLKTDDESKLFRQTKIQLIPTHGNNLND
jgi:talin